ncbi:MAG TPA: LssY C-terminal domain-containing protein [Candidatus Acidoferrum sp.]|nr:LssY C-terminal domain-containing protein [Candidatus Acidoferrum sp.]
MKSKASSGTCLGSVFFLLFLSAGNSVLAQSPENQSSSQTAQPTATPGTKPAAPTDVSKATQTKSFTLDGAKVWLDTEISLEPGQRIAVTSEGTLRYADAKADNGPDGLTRGFKDLIRILPYNGAGRGAVIGRIGDADIAQPFVLGAKKEIVAPVSGKLALGINQSEVDAGTGSYTVKVEVYPVDSSAPREIAKEVSSIPGVDNSLFENIPRRIGDKAGNAGDMVNFLILGDEDQMKKVFTTAGWVKVDAGVSETVLAGFIASMSKESYLTMPMSQLYLFGRPQDYGWAHAEPITVVASRNHLRVWKAPFTVKGQTLWVGAATHDIGFEKDQRNNGLTHKIDPDIDLEKDYVQKTLSSTGLVAEVLHFSPKLPMLEARTATGGSFHSNGQVLVMKLAEAAKSTTASNNK